LQFDGFPNQLQQIACALIEVTQFKFIFGITKNRTREILSNKINSLNKINFVATATAGTYFNEGSSRLKALKQGDQMRL
jgi:hypothetical protein